jgi:hypothetical protein
MTRNLTEFNQNYFSEMKRKADTTSNLRLRFIQFAVQRTHINGCHLRRDALYSVTMETAATWQAEHYITPSNQTFM